MTGITNPSKRYFKDAHWTFDGADWHPQSQLLAYRDVVREITYVDDAPAGTNMLLTNAVATGYVWVIFSAIAWDGTNAVGVSHLYIDVSGARNYIDMAASLAVNVPVKFQGMAVLKAGEKIGARFTGVTLNDNLYLYANGYKFPIAE